MGLAEQKAEITKNAIRDAVADLLATEHPATLNIPTIAARAGVSVRTVYRYFPTKQALLDDAAQAHLRGLEAELGTKHRLYEQPENYLGELWRRFAQRLESVKAEHQSPVGAELRQSRLQQSRQKVRTRVRKRFPEATPHEETRLADLLICVTSSSVFLELHDRMGYEPTEAADLAMWMSEALQQRFATEGLDP